MTHTPDPRPPAASRRRAPAPLVVAASLVAVEAVLLVLQGFAEVIAVSGDRLTMGLTTTLFFLMYGGGLAFCAWSVTRLNSWARAPIVVAQLIQLLVAWSFRGGSTTPVAIALALVAVLVLVGIFHPASLAALAETTERRVVQGELTELSVSDSRRCWSVRFSSRDTCICETPISVAICD